MALHDGDFLVRQPVKPIDDEVNQAISGGYFRLKWREFCHAGVKFTLDGVLNGTSVWVDRQLAAILFEDS